MKKISGSTTFHKKVYPVFTFGMLGLLAVLGAVTGAYMLIIAPVLLAAIFFFLFRKLFWDLADAVYDHGDALEFRIGDRLQRVPLREITNVNYTYLQYPERVVIRTRHRGEIGDELAFTPPLRVNVFAKSPPITELIERVERAREG